MTSPIIALISGSNIMAVHTRQFTLLVPIKVKCYYCEGGHHINKYEKFKKDKDKYNLSRADIAKKYKETPKECQKTNISITEAAFSSKPQESTCSIEQLIGGMQLSDTGSDSN